MNYKRKIVSIVLIMAVLLPATGIHAAVIPNDGSSSFVLLTGPQMDLMFGGVCGATGTTMEAGCKDEGPIDWLWSVLIGTVEYVLSAVEFDLPEGTKWTLINIGPLNISVNPVKLASPIFGKSDEGEDPNTCPATATDPKSVDQHEKN